MAGLYIHIPFCRSRCIYCGFYSTTLPDLQDRYTEALCKEMELRMREKGKGALSTIYLGGGTPSQLSEENLQKIFLHINKVYDTRHTAEITMECNPDDLTDSYVAMLSQLPVNRISMGAQTFSDERLRFLRRRHTASQVTAAVDRLRKAGFGNISIDLMFGFPDETLADLLLDIEAVLALRPEHVSAYSLMVEEGTELYRRLKMKDERLKSEDERLKVKLSEETERQMYELLIDKLEAAGYEHYEISNFAKVNEECRMKNEESAGALRNDSSFFILHSSFKSLHNSSYWNGTPYIGIGAAAHSYDIESRQWNVSDIHKYMEAVEEEYLKMSGGMECKVSLPSRGRFGGGFELLDADTRYNDLVTTALRTREGIDLGRLEDKYRVYLLQNARLALDNGLLHIDGNRIHLTRQGLFVSDDVMSDLIWI